MVFVTNEEYQDVTSPTKEHPSELFPTKIHPEESIPNEEHTIESIITQEYPEESTPTVYHRSESISTLNLEPRENQLADSSSIEVYPAESTSNTKNLLAQCDKILVSEDSNNGVVTEFYTLAEVPVEDLIVEIFPISFDEATSPAQIVDIPAEEQDDITLVNIESQITLQVDVHQRQSLEDKETQHVTLSEENQKDVAESYSIYSLPFLTLPTLTAPVVSSAIVTGDEENDKLQIEVDKLELDSLSRISPSFCSYDSLNKLSGDIVALDEQPSLLSELTAAEFHRTRDMEFAETAEKLKLTLGRDTQDKEDLEGSGQFAHQRLPRSSTPLQANRTDSKLPSCKPPPPTTPSLSSLGEEKLASCTTSDIETCLIKPVDSSSYSDYVCVKPSLESEVNEPLLAQTESSSEVFQVPTPSYSTGMLPLTVNVSPVYMKSPLLGRSDSTTVSQSSSPSDSDIAERNTGLNEFTGKSKECLECMLVITELINKTSVNKGEDVYVDRERIVSIITTAGSLSLSRTNVFIDTLGYFPFFTCELSL